MVISKRYSLEDIIAEEVARQVGKSSSNDGGVLGNFGIKDISDITKLLKEVGNISQIMKGGGERPRIINADVSEGSSVNRDQGPVGASAPMLGEPAKVSSISLDVPRLVDNFINYIPVAIDMYGDLKLSEVHPILKKERESIISTLEAMMQK